MEVTDLRKVLYHYDILEKAVLEGRNLAANIRFDVETVLENHALK